jgi:phage shock protein A
MFKDLQRLFEKSVAAFRAELDRREPEDQVAELLSAMRRELTAAKASLPELKEEAERARRDLAREREELAQCERRGALAERIGDAETVRIAAEFAERHRERIVVVEQRLRAAEAEHALRERESAEMMKQYQEADRNRFALLAQLRRSRAQRDMRARLDGSAGPFADFARMEEAVDEGSAYADALESLTDSDPPPAASPPTDMEERLRELKRRMGRD